MITYAGSLAQHARRGLPRRRPLPLGRALSGGARSIKSMLWETSLLDPVEGIRFRGYSIPELQETLPSFGAEGAEPTPEGLFWLLMTGEVPTKAQADALTAELHSRATLPAHVEPMIRAFPKGMHPMTQLSSAILAMQTDSVFANEYAKGTNKALYADRYPHDTEAAFANQLLTDHTEPFAACDRGFAQELAFVQQAVGGDDGIGSAALPLAMQPVVVVRDGFGTPLSTPEVAVSVRVLSGACLATLFWAPSSAGRWFAAGPGDQRQPRSRTPVRQGLRRAPCFRRPARPAAGRQGR